MTKCGQLVVSIRKGRGIPPIAGKVWPGGWADPVRKIQLIAQGIILERVYSFGMILNYFPLNFAESLSKSDRVDHIFIFSAAS